MCLIINKYFYLNNVFFSSKTIRMFILFPINFFSSIAQKNKNTPTELHQNNPNNSATTTTTTKPTTYNHDFTHTCVTHTYFLRFGSREKKTEQNKPTKKKRRHYTGRRDDESLQSGEDARHKTHAHIPHRRRIDVRGGGVRLLLLSRRRFLFSAFNY